MLSTSGNDGSQGHEAAPLGEDFHHYQCNAGCGIWDVPAQTTNECTFVAKQRRHRGTFWRDYLQVNALGEWIIGIYLHEFTNNEWEISIPHEAASCGIENFKFIVSERVQVNPYNSRAMSALTFLLFKLNTLQTKIVKLWVSRSHCVIWQWCVEFTPRLLHHDYDVKEVVAS